MSDDLQNHLVKLIEEERFDILRIIEIVNKIAGHIGVNHKEQISNESSIFQFETSNIDFRDTIKSELSTQADYQNQLFPDHRLVRQIIQNRQLRSRFFDPALFFDPAWDMLLDLTVARAERVHVSVTSLCVASGVPATTALRWIKSMEKLGLFVRREDFLDRRRVYVELSENAAKTITKYFSKVHKSYLQSPSVI